MDTFIEGRLQGIRQVIDAGPFHSTWESLQAYTVPAWYEDARFGIFIHWGVYSVPAFRNEWYPRNMYIQGTEEFNHHRETYGPQDRFGYKDFIPMFKAEHFDPTAWAALFKRSGARFVVPVAEHHDGFAMYDCSLSEWCASKMGPRRDIIGELAAAVRQQGLVFGVSSHRAEHWFFMNGGMAFDSDVRDPRFYDFYGPATPPAEPNLDMGRLDSTPDPDHSYLDNWLARTAELIDLYQPQLLWFDWWIGHRAFEPYLQKLAAYYYNRGVEWQRGVAINYKFKAFPEGTAVLDIERGQLKGTRLQLWQNDTSVSRSSWGYVKDQDYKTAEAIIADLVDVTSKNGALLLNIGPRPDGTIPAPEVKILEAIGDWLAVNGEAIYATRPWKVFGEGPTEVIEGSFTDTQRAAFTGQDVRFTTRGESLYATMLGWPGNRAIIRSLGRDAGLYQDEIGRISLLGFPGLLAFERQAGALVIQVPEQAYAPTPLVFKITRG